MATVQEYLDTAILSNFTGQMLTYILIFSVFILIFAIGFFVFWYKKYNVIVEVNEKRGEGAWTIWFDKAKRVKENGVIKYRLLKSKIDIKPPQRLSNVYFSKGGDYLKLVKEGEGFFSFGIINEREDLEPI